MDLLSVSRNSDNMNKYVGVMVEAKLRTTVIDTFLAGMRTTGYKATDIETTGLQFRKMFELLAFASLAAHKELYSETHKDFTSH